MFQVPHWSNLVTELCTESIKPIPPNSVVEVNRKSNQKYALEIGLRFALMETKDINGNNYTVIEWLDSYYDLCHHCSCGQTRGSTSDDLQMVTVVRVTVIAGLWLTFLVLFFYKRYGQRHRHVELGITAETVS